MSIGAISDYQVMPALSDDDYAALKADIEARGVMVPVEYDESGNVLDGHHRVRICGEQGIEHWPRIVRRGLSDEGKRAHARALNLARRHLTQAQRRELIAGQLRETPQQSDRQIAGTLGVSDKTVGAVREELTATAEIPQLAKRTGADGKERKQPKPKSEKPKQSTFISADDAKLAAQLPRKHREAVMSGTTSASQAAAEVIVETIVSHRSEPEEPLATSDTPAFDPPTKPLTNNQRKFNVTEAIRSLAETDVQPDELQGLMKPFEYPEVEEFLRTAMSYLDRLNHAWNWSANDR